VLETSILGSMVRSFLLTLLNWAAITNFVSGLWIGSHHPRETTY
jgi:hypothetical protein